RRSLQIDRHLERNLLARMDFVKIHVDDPRTDRVALDLADQRLDGVAFDGQVDQRALGDDAGQRLFKFPERKRERFRVATMTIYHRGDLPLESSLPGAAFPLCDATLCFECDCLCHDSLSLSLFSTGENEL